MFPSSRLVFLCATDYAARADGYTTALGCTRTKYNVERCSATFTIAAVWIATVVAMVVQGLTFWGTYGGQTVRGSCAHRGCRRRSAALYRHQGLSGFRGFVVSWSIVTQAGMVSQVDRVKTLSRASHTSRNTN